MLNRLICWLLGHDSPTVGTPATDFTCKRCGWVPEYCVVSRWNSERGAAFEPDPCDPLNEWRELGFNSPDDYFTALAKAVKEE